jgi:trehalose/maltose transport system substrate-binding protein
VDGVRRGLSSLIGASLALFAGSASATTITLATGGTSRELAVLRQELDQFTARTGIDVVIAATTDSPLGTFGQYQRWLSGRNATIDLYRMDITWTPQLARHLADLAPATADMVATKLPLLIKSQMVGDTLVGLPYAADVPALFYRRDLLDKYRLPVPKTWAEMQTTAATIMAGERKVGRASMWGYAFPGAVSEDLTANALEWVASNGGGNIVEDDGTISIDNVKAILAVEVAETWVGTISPGDVANRSPLDSLRLWLAGDAVFAREWQDAIAYSEAPDSAIRGKIGVAALPVGEHGDASAATLGGWSLAISRYSTRRDEATALVRFLASAEAERTYEVGALGKLPATAALYEDPGVTRALPELATFRGIIANAVLRPAAQTGEAYGRVSVDFAVSINRSLKQDAFAEDFLQSYRHDLEAMKAAGWRPTTPRGQIGDTAP